MTSYSNTSNNPTQGQTKPHDQIRLIELRVDNFKGIKHFTLESGGADIAVYGNNAAGKTTLADAFSWLLFGKDSQGRADFSIKTLSATGEALHGLEHSVEAVLSIGEEKVELRKVYREKWTKRRGSADKEFTGHTRDHFVDGVPVNQGEYEARIEGIASEHVFQLLTDPIYFSERLHWQGRRRLLLEICGDISDADVIASSRELSDLPEVLAGRTIDDHRKVALARKRKINEQLERIPVRIDEVSRGLPEIEGDDLGLKTRLGTLRQSRNAVDLEHIRIKLGGEIAEKTKQIREVEAEILAEINKAETAANACTMKLRQELAKVEDHLNNLTRETTRLELNVQDENEERKSLKVKMEGLRGRWHEIDSEKLDPGGADDFTCAACGQILPEERVVEARKKALAVFNSSKARRLQEISEEGKRYQARFEELKRSSEKREGKLTEWKAAKVDCNKLIEIHKDEIEKSRTKESVEAFGSGRDLVNQKLKKLKLEAEIEKLGEGNEDALKIVTEKLLDLDKRIADLEAELSRVEQRRAGEERIEELKREERQLAAEYEELELQIHLIDEFTRRKVSMLTDRINSQFELARFKLFDIQVNGGIVETCEVTYDGVPWPSLNTGAQVNIGLDMIRTFSAHYGIAPPIFIDHSESVIKLLETPGQQIRLIVSDAYKGLHVEEAHVEEAVTLSPRELEPIKEKQTDERRRSEEVK